MPADARAVSCETALCEGGEGKGVSQAVVLEQHAFKIATSARRRRLSRDMPSLHLGASLLGGGR